MTPVQRHAQAIRRRWPDLLRHDWLAVVAIAERIASARGDATDVVPAIEKAARVWG